LDLFGFRIDSVRQVSHIYIGSCRSGGRLSEF
jgi:hypothetical protein